MIVHIMRRLRFMYSRINSGEHLTDAENAWVRRANRIVWRVYQRNPL